MDILHVPKQDEEGQEEFVPGLLPRLIDGFVQRFFMLQFAPLEILDEGDVHLVTHGNRKWLFMRATIVGLVLARTRAVKIVLEKFRDIV